MSINRIKYIYDLVAILTGAAEPINLKDLARTLSNLYEEEVPTRRVKQYLQDIDHNFPGSLENTRGRYGGYQFSENAKKNMIKATLKGLNKEDRNAVNDAFEIAVRSPSFHYHSELKKAKGLIYESHNLKDQDYEYYIGKENPQLKNKEINRIKKAMIEGRKIRIESKYDYYELEKGIYLFSPLFMIHDTDETMLILKDEQGAIYYQNFNNIENIELTNKTFERNSSKELYYHHYVKGTTFKNKNTSRVTLGIRDQRAWRFYDMHEHECKEVKRTKTKLTLEFYEDYKAVQFLLIVKEYVKILEITPELKEYWSKKIKTV